MPDWPIETTVAPPRCTCNENTSGRYGCAIHNPHQVQAGIQTAMELHDKTEAARLCRLGYHAWTPWLGLPTPDAPTRFVTQCGRPGCYATEQYDL